MNREFHDAETERFKPLITFFDTPAIYVLALGVDLLDIGEIPDKNYQQIWVDLIEAFNHIFKGFRENEFFEELRINPYKYLYKRDEIREWINQLKLVHGKRVFLVT